MKKPLIIFLTIFIIIVQAGFSAQAQAKKEEKPFAIAIHGGAGTMSKAYLTPEKEKAYKAKLKQAVDTGYMVLKKGGSSVDAVIAAIRILEHSPLFNAGKGAVYTYEETHELDASIMEGKTLNAGAVAGVSKIKSPIQLAKLVMDKSEHVMLSGQGAEQFAQSQGVKLIDNHWFDTESRYKSLQEAKQIILQKDASLMEQPVDYKFGTVGAVALDRNGDLAAGTSTGGMSAKRFGRIGDSPIIGAGTYANNDSCAVSATGHGEYFIRYHVAADICARVQYLKKSVHEAATTVIQEVLKPAGGNGGVIVIDTQGEIATVFNTEGMYRAVRAYKQDAKVAIYK